MLLLPELGDLLCELVHALRGHQVFELLLDLLDLCLEFRIDGSCYLVGLDPWILTQEDYRGCEPGVLLIDVEAEEESGGQLCPLEQASCPHEEVCDAKVFYD